MKKNLFGFQIKKDRYVKRLKKSHRGVRVHLSAVFGRMTQETRDVGRCYPFLRAGSAILMKRIYFLLGIVLLLSACAQSNEVTSNTSSSIEVAAQTDTTEAATEKIITKYGDYDDEDFDDSADQAIAIDLEKLDSLAEAGISITDGAVNISKGGVYALSGDYQGQIHVATEDTVHLILNNATIKNDESAAIYIESAAKVIITLAAGSENKLTDGSAYALAEGIDEPSATLFSKDDLTINGSGSLEVSANYNNGIQGKDDLVITGGNIKITAKNNAIKGKDSISIAAGTFDLTTTEGDAIQASNETETDKGWIAIDNGTFQIASGTDALQAAAKLSIADGVFTIKTADGSASTADAAASYKGLKAAAIQIDAGSFTIDAYDDGIHANGDCQIDNGEFAITTGDDGIHADGLLRINNGTIDIVDSYEGLEGSTIEINDGTITVKASDDGLNAGGDSDTEAAGVFGADDFGGGPGGGDQADESKWIEVNGGMIYVAAAGDGVDSNGNITMSAGTLVVNGPENGGTLIASGSTGMAQTVSAGSQAVLDVYFDSQLSAGETVNIATEDGTEIATIVPKKTFQHLVISSPKLTVGSTINLSTGGQITGTDFNGYYENGEYSGGELLTTTTLAKTITSISQSGSAVAANQGMGGASGQR